MEIVSLQPNRILLTLFVSVLVAFVTAALSIVRLVNDKEGKTTDYRQAWTESLRKSLAELVSNINAFSGAIVRNVEYVDQINAVLQEQHERNLEKITETDATLKNHLVEQIAAERAHIRSLQRDLHQSYELTRLHFKPNDLSFARIEQKFDVVLGLLTEINNAKGESANQDRLLVKEKIHAICSDITAYARDILKTEWENVKRGEPAYQQTKRFSLAGGAAALFVLFLFGGAAAVSYIRSDPKQSFDDGKNGVPNPATTSGAALGAIQQAQPPAAIQPQTSQVVNVYPVAPNGPAHPRPKPLHSTVVPQQPCSQ